MDPQYSFPPPLNHPRSPRHHQQLPQSSSSVCSKNTATGQQTCVQYSYPQPIDIPHRSSQEIASPGKHRNSGIGNNTLFYRHSGIGNNTLDDRNSGIGKLCYEEGGSRLSGSFSSLRKLAARSGTNSPVSMESMEGKRGSIASRASGDSVKRRESVMSRDSVDEVRSEDETQASSTSSLPRMRPGHKPKHERRSLHHFFHF
ncbi:hypothetical protein GGH96_001614 [Coemansia sp. RSA 1972]|nr:hypothetical protein GGH96_001614 [Coemansia sp. RSA 1972]